MSEDPHHDNFNNAVWTYRGYQLEPSQFTTAIVHLYRAEIQRSNLWRSRLDATTNWSVVTSAAALTFTFDSPSRPHFILLLVLVLLLAFLNIEARRYRYYVLWYRRSRLLETNFFAPMMSPPYAPSPDWSAQLEQTLLNPHLSVAWWESVGHRFRRNYLWLITFVLLSWIVKLNIHPSPTTNIQMMIERAAISNLVSGPWVTGIVGLIYGYLIILAIGIAIPEDKRQFLKKWGKHAQRIGLRRPEHPRYMATIITEHGQEIAERLMEVLERGVTSLEGQGMYSGKPRDVLLCALTEIQISQLQDIVSEMDEGAFVIINRAAEIRGGGFDPLHTPS
jgi:uncharacterized membrane protein